MAARSMYMASMAGPQTPMKDQVTPWTNLTRPNNTAFSGGIRTYPINTSSFAASAHISMRRGSVRSTSFPLGARNSSPPSE